MSLSNSDWATSSAFSGGPYPSSPNKVAPSSGIIAEGFDPGSPIAAEYINWLFNNHGQLINGARSAMFGNGSDGNVTVSTGVSLSRDMFYNSITVASGGVLNTNGFRVYVRDTLTTSGGTINWNGANALHAGITNLSWGSLSGGQGGLVGTNGAGSAPGGLSNAMGGNGGAGGTSGTAGGAGGTVTAPTASNGNINAYSPAMFGGLYSPAQGVVTMAGGAAGGSGGGGGGSNLGGAGGQGGGTIAIAAAQIVLANASDLQVHGGKGGDVSVGLTNCGGGGGGGGGFLLLAYLNLSIGSGSLNAAVNCAPGTGGAGSTGSGDNGVVGAIGSIAQINLS